MPGHPYSARLAHIRVGRALFGVSGVFTLTGDMLAGVG